MYTLRSHLNFNYLSSTKKLPNCILNKPLNWKRNPSIFESFFSSHTPLGPRVIKALYVWSPFFNDSWLVSLKSWDSRVLKVSRIYYCKFIHYPVFVWFVSSLFFLVKQSCHFLLMSSTGTFSRLVVAKENLLLRNKEQRRIEPEDNWVRNISSRPLYNTETIFPSTWLQY